MALLATVVLDTQSADGADRRVVQSIAPDGRSVALITGLDGTLVRDGETLERLDLAPSAWLNRIVALDSGWVAGGARQTANGQDLYLLARSGAAGDLDLPPPPARVGAIRHSAVPIVTRGRLAGLAWLEGDHHRALGVYAAALGAEGWGPVETVSAPGPGSQVALSGVVLDDRRWLLVWSRYDGTDTETVWSSRSAAGEWHAVTPLHEPNEVPDVAPTVIATRTGALAAWSVFDGETMRLRMARFADGVWEDTGLRGPDASLYPAFLDGEGGPRLLFQTVVPRGWTLLRLDARGAPIARARFEGVSERPVVEEGPDELVMIWPETTRDEPDRRSRLTWGAGG